MCPSTMNKDSALKRHPIEAMFLNDEQQKYVCGLREEHQMNSINVEAGSISICLPEAGDTREKLHLP